ncbi:Hypothetical predicted protein [Paramuricea clavata]|uniref:Uncharacterized protein n=1 Tax=Paramuricea clavata TaxID=317549 RepID=A0A7D9LJH1_PARCT|nr:Hypothetical predicted protein [Paramuricea clavata]
MSSTKNKSPDLSFMRYQFDKFKNTKAREVPFEEVDYSIYKASSNCIAFKTSEKRIGTWIKTFYYRYHAGNSEIFQHHDEDSNNIARSLITPWEEQAAYNDNTKCEKITLSLAIQDKNQQENIATIIIYCSTGIIQIQGCLLHEWGDKEFPILKDLVDRNPEESSTLTKELENFLKSCLNKSQPTTEESSIPTFTPAKTVSESSPEPRTNQNPARESISTIKNIMANLELNFVAFQQEVIKSFEDLKNEKKEKDKELEQLKKRIFLLEASNELLLKENTNLVAILKKQTTIEKKLKNITTQLEENHGKNTKQHDSKSSSMIDAIDTRNPFLILEDEKTEPRLDNDKIQRVNKEEATLTNKIITESTIILCDSNGHKLDTKLLCPDTSSAYIRCPTIESAENILKQHDLKNPKTIILHSGINDIEKRSVESICKDTHSLLSFIKSKHPHTRIILSSLLPRNDYLLEKAQKLNKQLIKISFEFTNTNLVKHDNLFRSTAILYDKKHLNSKGVKIFAKNLKGCLFWYNKEIPTHQQIIPPTTLNNVSSSQENNLPSLSSTMSYYPNTSTLPTSFVPSSSQNKWQCKPME